MYPFNLINMYICSCSMAEMVEINSLSLSHKTQYPSKMGSQLVTADSHFVLGFVWADMDKQAH